MPSNGCTQLSFAQVMEQHPRLTQFGIGVCDQFRRPHHQRQAALVEGRAALVERESVVLEIAEWLNENIAPIKTPTIGSYGMKHTTERAMGKYVANGELIAAALMVGYTVTYTQGPNAHLAMSRRDLKRVHAGRGTCQ